MKVRITEFGPGCASVTGGVSPRVVARIVTNTALIEDVFDRHLTDPKPLVPTVLCRTGMFIDEEGRERWQAKASCSECGWTEKASSFTTLTQNLGRTCHKKPPHEECPLPKRKKHR